MQWFSSIKSRLSDDDSGRLTKADVIEIEESYDDADSVFNYMIDGAKRYKKDKKRLKNYVTGEVNHISYDNGDALMSNDVSVLPVRLKNEFELLMQEHNPRKAESVDEAKRCFEVHEEFAREGKKVCEDVLDQCRDLKDKIETVEYREKTEDEFEHDGFDHPATHPVNSLSEFTEKHVSEDNKGRSSGEMYKLKINEIVYFIAEHIRKELDMDYDVESYQRLYNKNPEQADLIAENISQGDSEEHFIRSVKNLSSVDGLPPINEEYIEFYVSPRVQDQIPTKTPEEINLLS